MNTYDCGTTAEEIAASLAAHDAEMAATQRIIAAGLADWAPIPAVPLPDGQDDDPAEADLTAECDVGLALERGQTVAFDTALRTLTAQATTRYPGEQARIERGLVLALNGHVHLRADGTATVQSGTDGAIVYNVGHGLCDCPDFPRAPGGKCKHVWARCLVRKAAKLPSTPPPAPRVACHATYKGAHGMVIRDAQHRVFFQGDDDVLVELFDADQPQLHVHGNIALIAEQRRRDVEVGTDLAKLDALRMAR